jgi:hypothetical protein
MDPLSFLLARIANGERLRKPTPEEERQWASLFLLVAIYFGAMALSIRYASHFLDTVNALTLSVITAVAVCVLWFVPRILGRHVPAKVSYVLAAIAWSVLFLLAVTGRLV